MGAPPNRETTNKKSFAVDVKFLKAAALLARTCLLFLLSVPIS